jgi:5-hydroxyisourate hydrolase-like protein (transthyretin family)
MSRRLTFLALLTAASACDPCTGVVGCTVSSHVGASGRVLNEADGSPAAGIPIDFVRTGGVALERDSMRVVTDREGQFEFDVTASATGAATGYFRVHPADSAAYRVTGLELSTSNRKGEARTFGPWTTRPHVPDIAEIYIRGAPPLLAASQTIEFRPTSGVAVEGLTGGVFRKVSASNGWVPLFGSELRPLDAGDVIGDLTVFMPDPIGTVVRRDVHVEATPLFRPGLTIHRLGVGPSLEYHIALLRRGLGQAVQGASVSFQRTGGVAVIPPDWTGATDVAGRVAFPVRALASGVLTGDLKVVPPSPWKAFERKALSFPTFEADTAILYKVFEVGPGVSTYAVLRARGAPIKGVRVEFRRTGGLDANPIFFAAVSNDSGYVFLNTATQTAGEVIADLTIRPPSPYGRFVLRGVRFPAVDGDADPVLIGQWDVASPPAGAQQ